MRAKEHHGKIVKESYFKPEYVELEKERLWPRIWQMACRLEEIPQVGSYLTYDIADESVIVVRRSCVPGNAKTILAGWSVSASDTGSPSTPMSEPRGESRRRTPRT